MIEPPWMDDFAGTYADGIVWCNCGWFEVIGDASEYEIADAWGCHAEAEHTPADWNPGDDPCPEC